MSSRNSFITSFESATSSPRTPITPLTLLSTNSDQVFVLPNSNSSSQSSEILKISQITLGLKMSKSNQTETAAILPDNWEQKSVDQKLTAFMEVFLKSSDFMTHKIDNLGAR